MKSRRKGPAGHARLSSKQPERQPFHIRMRNPLILGSFFLLAISLAIFSGNKNSLEQDKDKLVSALITPDTTKQSVQETIDGAAVEVLANTNYELLRTQLGIRSDFAIHFEDEQGNLLEFEELENRTCIGSGQVQLNGRRCA